MWGLTEGVNAYKHCSAAAADVDHSWTKVVLVVVMLFLRAPMWRHHSKETWLWTQSSTTTRRCLGGWSSSCLPSASSNALPTTKYRSMPPPRCITTCWRRSDNSTCCVVKVWQRCSDEGFTLHQSVAETTKYCRNNRVQQRQQNTLEITEYRGDNRVHRRQQSTSK